MRGCFIILDQVRDIDDHELREVESGRERSDLKGQVDGEPSLLTAPVI